MRVQLIGHFEPCMTEIYLHIDARMADYMAPYPYNKTWQNDLKMATKSYSSFDQLLREQSKVQTARADGQSG